MGRVAEPNAETIEAMEELNAGGGEVFESVDALLADADKPLSQEAYLKDSGGCPVCLSSHIECSAFDVDSSGAGQAILCLSCGARWVDIYKFTGYEQLIFGAAEKA